MPDLLIGSRKSIRCYDKVTRTGTIVYIHPDQLYATVEFEGRGGKWREAFLLRHSKPEEPPKDDIPGSMVYKRPAPKPFTDADDKAIMESSNVAKTAQALGRGEPACYGRRAYSKKRDRRRRTRGRR